MNAELNLVPFIDLLSVCIVFLIATAVWIDLSSMPVDQALNKPQEIPVAPPPNPPPPPLTVHLRADGVWIGRKVEEGRNMPLVGDEYDWSAVEAEIETDRRNWPATEIEGEDTVYTERQAVLVTDDGIEYSNMITALDLTRKYGYQKTLLGGGPGEPSTAQR